MSRNKSSRTGVASEAVHDFSSMKSAALIRAPIYRVLAAVARIEVIE